MSRHEKWTCMICNKNKVNVTIASGGPNRPVCENQECQDEMRERMEKHNERLNKEEAKKILEQIQGIMNRGEKLTIDFEKYDLTEEQKELCRKYVKNDQNIEDLKKQRDKLEKLKKEVEKCDECGEIPKNGKYYEVGGEGNYCKSCAKDLVEKSNNSNDSSFSNAPSSNEKPCEECGLISLNHEYWQVGGKGHYCKSCGEKIANGSNNSSSNNQNNDSSNSNNDDDNNKKKKNIKINLLDYKPIVKSISEGKDKIDLGIDINIEKSPLSEDQKQFLRDYKKNNNSSPATENKSPLSTILICVGVGGLFISLLVLIKKSRSRRRKVRTFKRKRY